MDWPPKKNAAFNVHFPLYDNDGDLVSGATALDSEVSIDHGTFTDCTNEATEIATSSGVYYLALTQAEMDGDIITTITKTSTTNAKTAVNVMYTATRQLTDLAFPATTGRSIVVDANGLVDANAVKVGATGAGTAQTARDLGATLGVAGAGLTAVPWNAAWDAEVQSEAQDAITALALATAAALATVDGIVDDILVDTGTTLDGRIPAALVGGRMDASVSAMANDVVTAAALAADAATEIADAILKRDIDQVEATAALDSLCTAILKAVSRVKDNAGTLEVYRTNGTTLHMSQVVTTNAALDAISELAEGV
jgi:hypothetical protein